MRSAHCLALRITIVRAYVCASLRAKVDAIKDAISELQASRGMDKVWWMSAAGGLLAVMARGFKWI
jgi:hypothetical protein